MKPALTTRKPKGTIPDPKHHYYLPDGYEETYEYQYYLTLSKDHELDHYLKIKTIDGKIVKAYIPLLAYIFSKSSIELISRESQGVKLYQVKNFFEAYKKGWSDGLDYFDNNYKVGPQQLYSEYGQIYERTLHTLYYHPPVGHIYGQWRDYLHYQPMIFGISDFEKYGFYGALIFKVRELIGLHPILFSQFEKCTSTKHDEITEQQPDPISEITMKHLKCLSGKWRQETIMTPEEFKSLVINTQILIKESNVPDDITALKNQSQISIEFIRKTFYNLHRELNMRGNKKLWVDFLHKSFMKFENTSIETTYKNFSQYKGNYEQDLKLITLSE